MNYISFFFFRLYRVENDQGQWECAGARESEGRTGEQDFILECMMRWDSVGAVGGKSRGICVSEVPCQQSNGEALVSQGHWTDRARTMCLWKRLRQGFECKELGRNWGGSTRQCQSNGQKRPVVTKIIQGLVPNLSLNQSRHNLWSSLSP